GLCLLLWILTPHFLTVANALNVMEQTSINAIVAVGMTYVIVSGGIDLSVGSLLALSGVILAEALKSGWPAPFAVAASFGVYAAAARVLARTRFGRYVDGIGGNEEATRLSGVEVRFHKTIVYGVSGLTSAIAALLLTARLNSAQPIAGINYELDAIAATVIGGTSLTGGEGSLGGTIVGALIMGVLRNGLNLLGVSSFLQQLVIGAVIIAAVLVDLMLKEKRG